MSVNIPIWSGVNSDFSICLLREILEEPITEQEECSNCSKALGLDELIFTDTDSYGDRTTWYYCLPCAAIVINQDISFLVGLNDHILETIRTGQRPEKGMFNYTAPE